MPDGDGFEVLDACKDIDFEVIFTTAYGDYREQAFDNFALHYLTKPIDIDKLEISGYFPEMQALLSECKFNNCNHINEPSCAVKKALKDGRLAQTRYDSYLSIYNTDTEDSYR